MTMTDAEKKQKEEEAEQKKQEELSKKVESERQKEEDKKREEDIKKEADRAKAELANQKKTREEEAKVQEEKDKLSEEARKADENLVNLRAEAGKPSRSLPLTEKEKLDAAKAGISDATVRTVDGKPPRFVAGSLTPINAVSPTKQREEHPAPLIP